MELKINYFRHFILSQNIYLREADGDGWEGDVPDAVVAVGEPHDGGDGFAPELDPGLPRPEEEPREQDHRNGEKNESPELSAEIHFGTKR